LGQPWEILRAQGCEAKGKGLRANPVAVGCGVLHQEACIHQGGQGTVRDAFGDAYMPGEFAQA
jgi:hypothetical protein